MTTRNITSTVGSLLGAIGTTADTAGKIVEDIGKATDVLSFKLDAWRAQAKADSIITASEATTVAIERSAVRYADRNKEIKKLCDNDETFKKFYEEEKKRLEELFKEIKPE